MAVGFGFSVSDLVLGLKLIRDSIDALNDTKGASADYEALVNEITSLQDGLGAVEELQSNENFPKQQQAALDRAVLACQKSVEEFVESISKYQPHLRASAAGFESKFRKVKWALCKKNDVAKFRAQLGRHASSINMLLITFQAKQTMEASKSSANSSMAIYNPEDTHIASMLDSMTIEHRQCFMVIMRQNKELLQTVQDVRKLLQMQAAMPPQILLQQPVVLLDPFGRLAPFHLEFVDSPECFMAVLKARFTHAGAKPSGLSKLDNSEFCIESTRLKRSVDLTKRWDRVFQRGEQYDMRMIFHRFACPPSTCPSCLEMTDDDNEQVQCQACGLQYQNVQAISKQSREWDQHFPEGENLNLGGEEIPYLLRHNTKEPELRVFRPTESDDDEIFEGYRRVQIVSQSIALLDQRFPALQLVGDFCHFAELVADVPPSISPYSNEIRMLHSRATKYMMQQNSNFPAFSSFTHIEQLRKRLTTESLELRQDIDKLVRLLCEDPETKDLVRHIKQNLARDQTTGYYTGVLTRMVSLSDFAKQRDRKGPRAVSQEKMQWMLLDSRPK